MSLPSGRRESGYCDRCDLLIGLPGLSVVSAFAVQRENSFPLASSSRASRGP